MAMQRVRGFTLIEILVVLAMVAFLAFMTVPMATGWIRNAQLERDFAGIQQALGTAKALAMRNSSAAGAVDAAGAFVPAVALCRAKDTLIIYQRGVPNSADQASCNRVSPVASNNKPIYSMGQDVAITFGANNLAFCGAAFDARGSLRLCRGVDCTSCDLTFDPTTNAGALKVAISGADATTDPDHDQTQLIRAF
jgi:prepilin-type N-terminal cleavage/methylation domain-containing protein